MKAFRAFMKAFRNTMTVQEAWDKFYPLNVQEKRTI